MTGDNTSRTQAFLRLRVLTNRWLWLFTQVWRKPPRWYVHLMQIRIISS